MIYKSTKYQNYIYFLWFLYNIIDICWMKSATKKKNGGRKKKNPKDIILQVPVYLRKEEINLFSDTGDNNHDRNILSSIMTKNFDKFKIILLENQ